jgi:putative membrane protein insertion efficiency factor
MGHDSGLVACSCADARLAHSRRATGSADRAALFGLRLYKAMLSPLFAGSCRYLPSCSDYTAEAVERHGAAAGIALGLWRLARCQPLGGSGFDPVPEREPWRALVSRRQRVGPGAESCAEVPGR